MSLSDNHAWEIIAAKLELDEVEYLEDHHISRNMRDYTFEALTSGRLNATSMFVESVRDHATHHGFITRAQARGVLNAVIREVRGEKPEESAIPEPINEKAPESPSKAFSIPDGYYAVEVAGKPFTVRFRTQKSDARFKPGEQIVSYQENINRFRDYKGVGHIDKSGHPHVWKNHRSQETLIRVLIAEVSRDFREAAARFGKATGRCGFCSLTLEREDSQEFGYGPICAEKHGLPFRYENKKNTVKALEV